MLEAIDNATDNIHRVPATSEIRVTLDATGFTCSNNGAHIPIQQKNGQWVPSTIFTEMHSGSNFSDTATGRIAAGMNGLGIKLAAILSDEFVVECVDPIANLCFSQRATDGLETLEPPKITRATKKQLQGMTTTVHFVPHLAHFGIDSLELLSDRVYTRLVQLSCTLGGKVRFFFNASRITLRSFQKYIQAFPYLYAAYTCVDATAEYGFALSSLEEYSHHSFVNHLYTDEGGTHLRCIESQITGILFAHFDKKKRKNEDVRLSRANIRSRLVVFCSVQTRNPEFKSQAKRCLTSPFSGVILDPLVVLRMAKKCGLLDHLAALLVGKETLALGNALNSRKKKTVQIENLTDASYAGTSRSGQCSLLVVEGLSAKTFAVSGLAEVGHQRYGIFPLRGKPVNTFSASQATISKNKEIGDLCKILGLVVGRDYSTVDALATLRYRHMVVLTDADVDGYHICGLLLAFLQRLFPSLLQSGFVKRFLTPIIIASHRQYKEEFFTVGDYNQWVQSSTEHAKWSVKYFKGLGSSTKDQARGYFKQLNRYIKPMIMEDDSTDRIALLFDAKKADLRKHWMQTTIPSSLDYTATTMGVTRFVDTELHDFSMETLTRAIPALVDGLKESQRKVLYAAIQKCTANKNQEIKIAQLGAYAAEVTAYAHGEKSIQDTCNKMTHSFVGSNNLHLLDACGNTGSRLQMGADAASTRYTFTRLMPYTRTIFSPLDDPLLVQRTEEGLSIEFSEFAPILPMILINGCTGIATGYRTIVPCHRVQDIIGQLQRRLTTGEGFIPMRPHYNGWTGTLDETETEWRFTGHYVLEDNNRRCIVTELPVMCATERYKTKVLHALVEKRVIMDLIEAHPDEDSVRFEFTTLSSFEPAMLELTSTISKKCMNLLVDGRIRWFESTTGIMDVFFARRLVMYQRRRCHLLTSWTSERDTLVHRRSFIEHVLEDRIEIRRTTKANILRQATALGIPVLLVESFVQMSFLSLTVDRISELDRQIADLAVRIEHIRKSTPEELWLHDLQVFEGISRTKRELGLVRSMSVKPSKSRK
jgi:DNA topoisomerase-2